MTHPRIQPAVVLVVGAGPRGTNLVERLAHHAPALLPGRPLRVHVADPHPFVRGWGQPPANVTVHTHRALVTDLAGEPNGLQRATLGTGETVLADVILLAQGLPGTEPNDEQRVRAAFADWHGLCYVRPREGDAPELDAVLAGVDVLVREAGPRTHQAIALLLEGRGGRFVAAPDGQLVYRPSGAEPRLHLLAPEWPTWTHALDHTAGEDWARRRAALVRARVLVEENPQSRLFMDAVRGAFVLHGEGSFVAARTLIEPDVAFGPLRSSADQLLCALARRGELAGWSATGAFLDRRGVEHDRRYAFGVLTSGAGPAPRAEISARRTLTLLASLAAPPTPAAPAPLAAALV
jgi:hypothetical protein